MVLACPSGVACFSVTAAGKDMIGKPRRPRMFGGDWFEGELEIITVPTDKRAPKHC